MVDHCESEQHVSLGGSQGAGQVYVCILKLTSHCCFIHAAHCGNVVKGLAIPQ